MNWNHESIATLNIIKTSREAMECSQGPTNTFRGFIGGEKPVEIDLYG